MSACCAALIVVVAVAVLALAFWWAHRRDLRRKFYKGREWRGQDGREK